MLLPGGFFVLAMWLIVFNWLRARRTRLRPAGSTAHGT
jgi:hypothetical protein